jgi:hypothetical protein
MRRAVTSGAAILSGVKFMTGKTIRDCRRAGDTHKLPPSLLSLSEDPLVSRDYEPAIGQWYENIEDEDTFRVLSVDEDSELVEIEYLDGDIDEIDLEAWHDMDLELIEEPEGWSDEDEDDDEDDDDEDDDWDEDEDEDDDDWDDDEDDEDDDEDE